MVDALGGDVRADVAEREGLSGISDATAEPVEIEPVVEVDELPLGEPELFAVPALEVAPSVTVPASQREAGVVELTEGVVLTVAVTAVLAEVQLFKPAST